MPEIITKDLPINVREPVCRLGTARRPLRDDLLNGFLDPTTAALLQYLTFPMEVAGFTLALIEVRFPAAAQRIARAIARLAYPLEALRGEADSAERHGGRSVLARGLNALLSRVLTIGFLAVATWYLFGAAAAVLAGEASTAWAVGQLIGFLVTVVVTVVALTVACLAVYFAVTGGSDFVQRFVAGRAVGTLGLLIAAVALLGEGYQFAANLVTSA